MLNEYVWKLYMKSGGSVLADMFKEQLSLSMDENYAEAIRELKETYCVSQDVINDTQSDMRDVLQELQNYSKETTPVENEGGVPDINDESAANEAITSIFEEWYQETCRSQGYDEKMMFNAFSNYVEIYSTLFAVDFPELFVPYYFYANYNVLTIIAETFDIKLPEMPQKADYKGRTWHYAELCKAFWKFRYDNGLSSYELCAFLYDFAPNYIGGVDSYIVKELPEPKSAYFIGGGGDNSDAFAEDEADAIMRWQCNPGTRAGDMIVMYLRTPISAISSVWRSFSVGFIDPFFYYYRCTYIGNPVKVKRMNLNAIKKDKILGKMPIVSKNMQGINGVELKPSEYNHMVDVTKGDVPKLQYEIVGTEEEYVNEKAVEECLIKPLLAKIGYGENDYVQQLYMEIGNHNHTLIPDFVLKPACGKGHYSGFALIEAKRSITNEKQMRETKVQARSYAKLLGVRYAAIASQEGIWVTSAKDDYTEDIFSASWKELKDNDTFYALDRLIGNR